MNQIFKHILCMWPIFHSLPNSNMHNFILYYLSSYLQKWLRNILAFHLHSSTDFTPRNKRGDPIILLPETSQYTVHFRRQDRPDSVAYVPHAISRQGKVVPDQQRYKLVMSPYCWMNLIFFPNLIKVKEGFNNIFITIDTASWTWHQIISHLQQNSCKFFTNMPKLENYILILNLKK